MTRREKDLVEALIGQSRVWVDTYSIGMVFAAGRGTRSRGAATPAKGGGSKRGGSSKKQGSAPKSTGSRGKAAGAAKSLTKRPGAVKGTGKMVGKSGRSAASRTGRSKAK